ncbi:hypothetical protein N7485_001677 [Penicillium canescens]|nr:hypothetical protein N7485_001677 [Penicillium canescens]
MVFARRSIFRAATVAQSFRAAPVARRSAQALGRRFNSTGGSHEQGHASSDLPWLFGSVAVTGPMVFYLWPSGSEGHGHHDAHGDEHKEEHKEEEGEKVEEAAEEAPKEEDKATQGGEEKKDEEKGGGQKEDKKEDKEEDKEEKEGKEEKKDKDEKKGEDKS